jgi:hypothetical protein
MPRLGTPSATATTATGISGCCAPGTPADEVFAQHIHQVSGRQGPLVPVNCAALPREMVESLLFGHRRGAFTGAVEAGIGFVRGGGRRDTLLGRVVESPARGTAHTPAGARVERVTWLAETRARRVDFRLVTSAQADLSARRHWSRSTRSLRARPGGRAPPAPVTRAARGPRARWSSTSRRGGARARGGVGGGAGQLWVAWERPRAADRLRASGILVGQWHGRSSSTLAEAIAPGAPGLVLGAGSARCGRLGPGRGIHERGGSAWPEFRASRWNPRNCRNSANSQPSGPGPAAGIATAPTQPVVQCGAPDAEGGGGATGVLANPNVVGSPASVECPNAVGIPIPGREFPSVCPPSVSATPYHVA